MLEHRIISIILVLSILFVSQATYQSWVQFHFNSLNGEFNITDPILTWGRWFEDDQDHEIFNSDIASRTFKPHNGTKFGATGRAYSPSGVSGGFVIRSAEGIPVLHVFFSDPFIGDTHVLHLYNDPKRICVTLVGIMFSTSRILEILTLSALNLQSNGTHVYTFPR